MVSSASPRLFGPKDRTLFGWYHPSSRRDLGVVVVSPFGYEAICAHRSLRHLAEDLARAGFPSWRFDLDGTGDSAGDDRDPDRVGAWVRSIHAACEALKGEAGVERVVLLGLRLGALLAGIVASEREDCVALVALAPAMSGRAYARELKILQAALDLAGPPPGVRPEEGIQEALGFAITEETRAALGKLALDHVDLSRVGRVLVFDRDDLPGAERWLEGLVASGIDAAGRTVPGYVEMMLDPHEAVVPARMLEAVVEAIGDAFPEPQPGSETTQTEVVPTPSSAVVQGVVETPHRLAGGIFGILSAPQDAPRSGRGIVLLNAGAVHRVGPNRLYTRFARAWAGAGHVVLRCDLTGIGDSPPRPGQPENVVYGDQALVDVEEVVRWLRQHEGLRRVDVVGLCSGAYHGLEAAIAGQPIDGVVSINPLTFDYDPSEPLDVRAHKVAIAAKRYATSMKSVEKWRKLLRGEIDRAAVARTILRRAQEVADRRLRDLRRRLGIPHPNDLGADLERLAKRHVPLRFVFASDDPGRELLTDEGGSAVPALLATPMLGIEVIDNPDHTFTQLWSHALLEQALARALDALDRGRR
ncbi:MAG: alpha/beta fold hydrolase [Polyangiaceae bacterium]